MPAAVPALLNDLYSGLPFSDPTDFTEINGVSYFAASDGPSTSGGHYRELWKSNGTGGGTSLVKDINTTATNSSNPRQLTAIGNTLYFIADNGVNGSELWKSDGTAAGTVMVKDITAGSGSSDLRNLTAIGAKLYFTFSTTAAGEELWVSDGTSGGTFMVKDINPGAGSSVPNPVQMAEFNGLLYFSATDGAGYNLWKSDGTSTGTVFVVDVSGGFGSSYPKELTVVGSNLCFTSLFGVYKTTGAVGNSTQLNAYSAASLANVNGSLFFTLPQDGTTKAELWKSNLTPVGTTRVKLMPLGSTSGLQTNPGPLVTYGTSVFFSFDDGSHGFEPWISDGTDAGTKLLLDVTTGTTGSFPGNSGALVFDNAVYFSANDLTHGTELWKTDGTTAGTTLTLDVNPGSHFGYNGQLAKAGANLYFSGYDESVSGIEPWIVRAVSDVTAPTIVGVYLDGASWTSAFRTAAGNASYGRPAQTGASQLTTLPWSTINTVYVKFSENVAIDLNDLAVRGLNVANYTVSTLAYDNVNFVAKFTLSGAIDTDRLILDLDGDSATAVVDAAGNKLAGAWTESVSAFPTAGAAGSDFKYRFLVAVGDADRNGLVRNADINLVRGNLFVDAGQAGYNVFADVDGNGLVRNADVNTARSHLFVDPPAGPGPNRPGQRGSTVHRNWVRSGTGLFDSAQWASYETTASTQRRLADKLAPSILDALFAEG